MDNSSKLYGYWRILMWGGAAALLSLPALAMRFFPDSGVNWSGGDFAVMGAMLLIACAAVEIGSRMSSNLPYRAGVIVAVGTAFLTVWVNLAVGMIQGEGNPMNLVFLGVIGIALFGAFGVRFAARGMAIVMATAAIAQVAIAIFVAIAGLDKLYTAVLIGLFALPWLLSAGLFQIAAKQKGMATA
ncbi:hypothetical protein [Arenimonas sp.]|uniref:hypothetical protein n=1 Tax=Arenimonas sp. TaxID=1872635 RepID=UPI0039E5AC6A